MYTYLVHANEDVFSSTKIEYPIPLNGTVRFKVPVPSACALNYVELKFGTNNIVCSGTLIVILKHDTSYTKYVVPIDSLKSNAPYRFALDKHPVVKDSLEITLVPNYSSDNTIVLWANRAQPYVVVNGSIDKTYNIEDRKNIVLITPVYNPKLSYFQETVQSVFCQVYDIWRWVIVDDGSTDDDLLIFLSELSKDPRIQVITSSVNEGISCALNKGLEAAKKLYGDKPYYAALLDHDDTIHPAALVEISVAASGSDSIKVLYTDEDKIDDRGQYSSPYYKPHWSYHMFLNQMYTCHMAVYSSDILSRVGPFRKDYDGSQDYDYMLRCTEVLTKEERIYHIPSVLYHWRKHDGSAAGNLGAKPEAAMNAVRSIKSHLDRIEYNDVAVTRGMYPGTYRLHGGDSKEFVRIFIPTYDRIEYLRSCLFSISQSTHKNYDVVVVTNNKDTKDIKNVLTTDYNNHNHTLIQYPKEEFNFSAMLNYAVKKEGRFSFGRHGYYLFLNDDIEVLSIDWLQEMLFYAERQDVGAVGAKLLYPDMRIQHAGVIIGIGGIAGHSHKNVPNNLPGYFSRPHIVQDVSAVTGACLMTSKKVFEELDGFEEKLPRAFNDVDYCLKIHEIGKKVIYTPHACLVHHESVSRGPDSGTDPTFQESIKFMEERWHCSTYSDPYYSSRLTLQHEDFSSR